MIKKIIITGANGLVGKNIKCSALFKKYQLIPLTRNKIDLLNKKEIKKLFLKIKPDLIIHSAAKVGGIGVNYKNNYDFFDLNLKINHNVITAAKEANINKLINFGSSCMYPILARKPLKEESISINHLEKTNEGYALSKIVSLCLCNLINKDKFFKYVTIIPCNLYGNFDNFDTNSSHLIAAAIKKIITAKLNKLKNIEIWGDGNVKREFMHVEDLVKFIHLLIQKFDESPNIINVGTGKELKIIGYYKIIAKLLNYKLNFYHNHSMPSGQLSKVLNIQKSLDLGFVAKTKIEDGIKKTIKFYQKYYV